MLTVMRALRYLRDHGALATIRVVFGAVRARLYLDEAHVWYSLDLSSVREGAPLAEGLHLVRAAEADVDAYVALGAASEASTRARLHAGATLWLVTDGAAVAFACWTFQ